MKLILVTALVSLMLLGAARAEEVIYSCELVSATKGAHEWDQVVIDWELPSVELRYAKTVGTSSPFFERFDANTKTDLINQVIISISKQKWINVGAVGPAGAIAIAAERFRDTMNLTYVSTLAEDAWVTALRCQP